MTQSLVFDMFTYL